MARIFKGQPLDVGNIVDKRLNHKILRNVVLPVQQKSRDVDLVQLVDDVPAVKRPRIPVVPKVRNTQSDPFGSGVHGMTDSNISALS